MAKRRKIVTFYSWFYLTVEDVFLGRSSLLVSVAWNELSNTRETELNKMVEGKEYKFRGFPEASWRPGPGGVYGLSYTVWPQQRKWQRVMI